MKLKAPPAFAFLFLALLALLAPPASYAQDPDPNINTKYVVADVDVRGVPRRQITPELRKALDDLLGKPLDTESSNEVVAKLRAAFPGYHVDRRVVRAEKKGTLSVIYILHRPVWASFLRHEPVNANALYHSDQGWGAVLPFALSGMRGDVQVMPIVTWSNADDFIEENSGFGLRVESRRLGTERLGMSIDWSTLDAKWREPSLAALAANPQLPAPYRNRMSFTPLLKFAFTPQVSVAGGVGVTELDPLAESSGLSSQMANVAIGSVRYRQRWSESESSPVEHQVGAVLTLRKGTSTLESDFAYDRYLGEADYVFHAGKHRVFVSGMAGRITGDAPLFERFTLGDSRTLRGWDKYDIAPGGGDRMFHASLEYRFRGAMLFVDAGSVWDSGADKRVRFSTGGGFTKGPLFFTLGFPVNTDEARVVVSMGFHFGLPSTGIRKF